MKEELVFIKNNKLIIEGLLSKSSENKGVIICHPHPQMGGSMYNNVVEAIQEAFSAENYSTLRFNFRGVGDSTGSYDEGRGEQEDIIACIKYLQDLGIFNISFAGYSFGSWIGSKIIGSEDHLFNDVILISPPVNFFNFDFTKLYNKIDMIICGDYDQFCDISFLKKQMNILNYKLEIVNSTDHFYMGREKEIENILRVKLKLT
jgi:alpha/beta superfamily hydrolase